MCAGWSPKATWSLSFRTSGELTKVRGFVAEPTGQPVQTSFTLAFKFDEEGQIVDQWLGSNFVEMLAQLGWGFAPVGEPAAAAR